MCVSVRMCVSLCVCMWVHVPQWCTEVRGQLVGANSFLLLCGSWGLNSSRLAASAFTLELCHRSRSIPWVLMSLYVPTVVHALLVPPPPHIHTCTIVLETECKLTQTESSTVLYSNHLVFPPLLITLLRMASFDLGVVLLPLPQ